MRDDLAVTASDQTPASVTQTLENNLTASRAGSTTRAYASAWSAFSRYAGTHALPADPLHVAEYLSAIGERLRPATVHLHAAAIAARHRDAGLDSPCDHAGVTRALAGHARRKGARQKQARPLDQGAVRLVLEQLPMPRAGRGGKQETPAHATRRAVLDAALIQVMRDALLRRSEAAALTWEDVSRAEDGSGRLSLRRSKTDQAGVGSVCYLSRASMAALECLRTQRGEHSKLFGLSASQINRRIVAACRAAGLGAGFSGHSPRIGMAIDLMRSGTTLPALMTAGRWQSPLMPARYTRNEQAGRNAVAQLYGTDAYFNT